MMNITELEIHNVCECKHAVLKFPQQSQKSPLFLVRSSQNCEIFSLALQLICSTKYSQLSALHEIRYKISQAKVKIVFTLPKITPEQGANENSNVRERSSDSDEPCTSAQARQRLKRRLEKRSSEIFKSREFVVTACRDFTLDPNLIVYNVGNSTSIECSVEVFQVRFFSCTESIFPRLMNISHGEYCQGKWLDLLPMEFLEKGQKDVNYLLKKFCHLYNHHNIPKNHSLEQLTTSILKGCMLLNSSRISHLIRIFNDIRWLFEYMTCSEYTVWFLMPSVYGNLKDISEISLENTNFDLMKTQIQLKSANATPFHWLQAEKHVQELFMVAVQLAFGYHCSQNIIYLHSLNHLEKHQSFEFFTYSSIPSNKRQQFLKKDYFQRIFNVCFKLKICCVLEYCGGLPFYPQHAVVILCKWQEYSKEWQIAIKNNSEMQSQDTINGEKFLQLLNETLM